MLTEKMRKNLFITERGCLEWSGPIDKKGYGKSKVGHKQWYVHRLVFSHYRSENIDGLILHHTCENTRCANPNHLRPMTAAEHRKAHKETATHCVNGHEYTPENTQRTNRDHRICAVCNRDASKKYYYKNP